MLNEQARSSPPQGDRAIDVKSIGLAGVIALCFSALMLDGVDIQMMAFAAPLILKQWGIARLAFAPALGAALAGMVIGAVAGGFLGDRWGRRPTIALSLGVAGVLTIAVGFSRDISQMVLLRLIGGVGFGALYPNAFPLIAEFTRPESRSRVVILASVGTPLGAMLGAVATGWAMPEVGWRPCFYIAGCLTLALGLALLLVLPESLETRTAGRSLAENDGGALDERGRALGPSVLASPTFLRRTVGLWILAFCSGYAAYAFLSWAPVVLSQSGLALRAAIMGSFFLNAFTVVGAFIMAAAVPRIGSSLAVSGALATLGAGAIALASVISLHLGLDARTVGIMAALTVVGLGLGSIGGSIFMLAVELYPASVRATGAGLANGLARLGAVAVAFGGGLLLSHPNAGAWSFVTMVLVMLGAAGAGSILIDVHLPRQSVQ